MAKNTLKIRQIKRYWDKLRKLDLELGIWII